MMLAAFFGDATRQDVDNFRGHDAGHYRTEKSGSGSRINLFVSPRLTRVFGRQLPIVLRTPGAFDAGGARHKHVHAPDQRCADSAVDDRLFQRPGSVGDDGAVPEVNGGLPQ
jgi:hypothetical protein